MCWMQEIEQIIIMVLVDVVIIYFQAYSNLFPACKEFGD